MAPHTDPESPLYLDQTTLEQGIERLIEALLHEGRAVVDDALPTALVAALQAEFHAVHAEGGFRPAAIGRGGERHVDPEVRGDEMMWLAPDAPLPAWQAYRHFVAAYQQALNRALYLCIDHFEGMYARYPPGGGYAAHFDRFVGSEERVVTLILYLNAAGWCAEDGGELRIYAGDTVSGEYQTVLPTQGRLVTFITQGLLHEVMPGRRERLSLTGWFRTRGRGPLGL